MSASPIIALRKAIRAHLLTDAAMGGVKIFDEVPRNAEPPYVLFAETQMRDWSAGASRGAEQLLTLAVVTTQRGLGSALGLAQQVVDRLDEAPLILDGHALIDLRFVSMGARRDQSGRFARVSILFRATTEFQ
ncbi:DUF3168 domain-containing protein [Methylocystis sp. JAN1]|uniref:DUF3168 domain-containing protein n=1 Tax=Methylocystis sp. JAN1 TaxID=3397211 RepID=UPI003FA1AFF5